MQQGALASARRPDDRRELSALEAQANPVERPHGLATDSVFAHHIAEFDGQQLVPGSVAGVDSSEHDPPASPHSSAHDYRTQEQPCPKALVSDNTRPAPDRFIRKPNPPVVPRMARPDVFFPARLGNQRGTQNLTGRSVASGS